MALQGPLTVHHVSIPEAYIRVERISGSSREGWLVNGAVYADLVTAKGKDQFGMPNSPFETFTFHVDFDQTQTNQYAYVYDFMKNMSRFAQTVSV